MSKVFNTNAGTITTTDYLDGFQYKFDGGALGSINPQSLQFVLTSEGYYDFTNNSYIYNYTDHLGNVRLSYTDTSKDGIIQPRQYKIQQCDGPNNPPFEIPNCIDYYKPGEIVEVNNYYPFGMLHNYTLTRQNAYQYKYKGKELQETGMYDYGARMYMPETGRWGVVDPLAETSRRWSTYTYAYNSPIRFIDPDGMENEDIHLLGNLADKGLEQLNANSSLAMTKDSNGKLDTANLSKSEYNKLSETDKVLYDGIKNTSINSKIYAENNNVTPSGGLIPGGSFGGANYDSSTGISTGTQYTNPDVLANAESFTGTQKGTGITHEVVENVLITQESLNTKTDVPIKTALNPSPIFDKYHDQTRSAMKYDNLMISARTRFETVGATTKKYYEGFAGKKDANGKIQTHPLYKVYSDDKKLKK
ncbi:RHS repeat-associated core domain-containing protein [Chryseobacterium sp. JUb7]|uniref:RHS repeat-associated core domain-containing protein n=1 Tax=Chryseobacterium sp. JUb7 TaxID=2940599 RepID=UPI0038D3BF9E|nr:RHS repeat-associated protein [Chryseobacterium sp. JUb7]